MRGCRGWLTPSAPGNTGEVGILIPTAEAAWQGDRKLSERPAV